jgi:hypothetical protein
MPKVYEELPEQIPQSQKFMKSCRSRARKANIYEELPEQSPQSQFFFEELPEQSQKKKI